MRPALVCGLAIRPSSSRSAITLRIVAGDSSRPDGARQRARADRLAVGDVAFDQGLQQCLGALVEHGFRIVGRDAIFAPRRDGSLWCNSAHVDPLPSRCARRQVPGPKASAALLEEIAQFLVRQGLEVSLERETALNTGITSLRRAHGRRARRALRPRGGASAATARCSASRASSRATACRWSASTRAAWASSPTSPIDAIRRGAGADDRRRLRGRAPHDARRRRAGATAS